ncbi:MAG: hypothetical protein KF681_03795 [Bdellovibrionaceae bacterium]|nr:hypothetical protein [Pseudobdellovibrionaceae bacterium]
MKQQQPAQNAAGKNQSVDSKDSSFKRTDETRRDSSRSDMGSPSSERPERSQRDTTSGSTSQRQGTR